MTHLLGIAIGLVVLGLVFGLIERLFRDRPGPSAWRRAGAGTDIAWFAFTAVVTRVVIAVGVFVALVLVVVVTGGSVEAFQAEVQAGRFPDLSLFGLGAVVRVLPFGVQLLLGLLTADLIGYWIHRRFHRGRLWSFHAIHHSSVRLDWLASVRVHPVNSLIGRVLGAVPLLLLGFDPAVFAIVGPFLAFYGVLLHANVGWTFGPLRYVLASPVFHRWHHTAEEQGIDTNFSGLFPVWDLVFGTFFMPGRAPVAFGTPNDPVPAGLLGQLAYPFRRRAGAVTES